MTLTALIAVALALGLLALPVASAEAGGGESGEGLDLVPDPNPQPAPDKGADQGTPSDGGNKGKSKGKDKSKGKGKKKPGKKPGGDKAKKPGGDKGKTRDGKGKAKDDKDAKKPEPNEDKGKREDDSKLDDGESDSETSKDEKLLLGPELLITDELLPGEKIPSLPPLSMLPWLQAAANEFGVPFEVLTAIFYIESNFTPGLTSSAGAVGLMQFLRSTWETQGLDFDKNGYKDPNSPDAFLGAANYLTNSKFHDDVRKAIYSYNHSDKYVDDVIKLARRYAKIAPLLQTTISLTEAVPPTLDNFSYERAPGRKAKIIAKKGSPVVAATNGRVEKIEALKDGGTLIVIRDVLSGNVFRYEGKYLKQVEAVAHPKKSQLDKKRLSNPSRSDKDEEQSDGTAGKQGKDRNGKKDEADAEQERPVAPDERRRFYDPRRSESKQRAVELGQIEGVLSDSKVRGFYKAHFTKKETELPREDYQLEPMKVGTYVLAGSPIATTDGPLYFQIRPAGKKKPLKNPHRIIAVLQTLETSGFRKVKSPSALLDPEQEQLSVSDVVWLAESDSEKLAKLVLSDPKINIYEAGRKDIEDGKISKFTLLSIAYLAAAGITPSEITSLETGHSINVAGSGRRSNHADGRAVDITKFNGQIVLGNQQELGNTWNAIKSLIALPTFFQPSELISLHDMGGPSFPMGNHADHLHIGYKSSRREVKTSDRASRDLDKWWRGIESSMAGGPLPNLESLRKPSKWAVPVKPNAAERGKSNSNGGAKKSPAN